MVGSISTLGIGSGLQLQDILEQLREVDEQVINRKQGSITDLETQLEEFNVVKNKLLAMKGNALDLSLEGTYLKRTITNSDDTILTATVVDGATVQSAGVTVDQLATKSSWLSNGFAENDASIATGDGAFTFNFGGSAYSVEVSAGTTLSGLADLINDDSSNPGITASVIDDGDESTPYKLLVKADATGNSSKIDLTAVPDLMAMSRQQAADADLNAKVTIDSISYSRESNEFNDVLSGVTLSLQTTGSSTVSVSSDVDSLKELITGLVTDYNDAVQELQTNLSFDDTTGEYGVLARTTLRDIPYDLQNLMTESVDVTGMSTVTSMFDLGMSFNRDGTIVIDDVVLSAKLASNIDDVKGFFLGDDDKEIEGFADQVNDHLRLLTRGMGLIEVETTVAEEKIDALELQIEVETERLDKRYEVMTKQFIQLDRYMNQMTSLSSYLTSQFDSLSDMWGIGRNSN
ncbi:MAG: flagellar filament capping protein FliD [Desulfobulbaceae bacterium]|nr:flagellar filament capping protein FliD [Desulfobulbaceae bacterium]